MRDSPWTEEQLYRRLMEWFVKPRRWWRRDKPQARPTTEAELAAVEAEMGMNLSPEYRRFLLNFAHLDFGGFAPYTAAQLPRAVAEAGAKGLPAHLLPFKADMGNYFCFDTRAAGEWPVVYWNPGGKPHKRYESFLDWMERCWLAEV